MVICDSCGISFQTSYWQAKREHHFCNHQCYYNWRRTRLGNLNPHWKGGLIKKICPQCGSYFLTCPSNKNKRKYCSKDCKAKSQIKLPDAKRYGYGWIPNLKKSIIKRDNHHCTRCGNTKNLLVHHIDFSIDNHSSDNLITLCRSCHIALHNSTTHPRLKLNKR